MSTSIVNPAPNHKPVKKQPYPIEDPIRQMRDEWDRVVALRQSSLFNSNLSVSTPLEIARRMADAAERAFCLIAATTSN